MTRYRVLPTRVSGHFGLEPGVTKHQCLLVRHAWPFPHSGSTKTSKPREKAVDRRDCAVMTHALVAELKRRKAYHPSGVFCATGVLLPAAPAVGTCLRSQTTDSLLKMSAADVTRAISSRTNPWK